MDACQIDETEVFQIGGDMLPQLSTVYRNGASAGVCQCELAIGIELQMSLLSRDLLGVPFLPEIHVHLQSTCCGASVMVAKSLSHHEQACLPSYLHSQILCNSSCLADFCWGGFW